MYPIITITGGDRKGKRSQATLLAEVISAKLMGFPDYDTLTGQLLRGALTGSNLYMIRTLTGPEKPRDPENPNVEVLPDLIESKHIQGCYDKRVLPEHFQALNFMARAEKQAEILETLKTQPIVMDRYIEDAYVYGPRDGCDPQWVRDLQKPLRKSDLVIVLTGPTFSRDEHADFNETDSEFARQIDEGYRIVGQAEGWAFVETQQPLIDTTRIQLLKEASILATHQAILSVVAATFPNLVPQRKAA